MLCWCVNNFCYTPKVLFLTAVNKTAANKQVQLLLDHFLVTSLGTETKQASHNTFLEYFMHLEVEQCFHPF